VNVMGNHRRPRSHRGIPGGYTAKRRVEAILLSAVRRSDPNILGVLIDGDDTFIAKNPKLVVRYATPPEITEALRTGVLHLGRIKLGPPKDAA
jgi:hypothetical protein